MPQIRVTLSIGFVGAEHIDTLIIDEQEWNECATEEEKQALMNEYWQNWANNYIDGGAVLIE